VSYPLCALAVSGLSMGMSVIFDANYLGYIQIIF